MPRILLVRHGEVDGAQLDAEGWWGPARDFSPLSAVGIQQAKEVGQKLRASGATRIISSPMTRALQTAALIAAETHLPLTAVEFDLREWLPDATLSWRTAEAVAAAADFHLHNGEWPPGEARTWEPQSSVRRRATRALQRQSALSNTPFIAVSHSMLIESLTGDLGIEHCGVRELDQLPVADTGTILLPKPAA
ncbi:histidine phosphatase family protein [Kribbella jiaozuonensis]|uniref:histidine phosphatase family protein n=1 Tax=Kribbella jiaozuonensis TaxID=2575441 RepID=UPI001484FE16|nr:histidine phosphatase family protein [Kribbella jiaozuonensis]